jgi:hypothetical protein
VLALPLEAECLVDPELAAERNDGHNDGDAVNVLDYTMVFTIQYAISPEDDDCEHISAQSRKTGLRDGRTQWPDLSRDVLELADALGNGVGCLLSMLAL